MPIPDSDPRAKELDAAFEAAMSGPAKPRSEPKAPPTVDHDAPFGRDGDGNPVEKYGRTVDGKVRRSPAGRKSRSAQDAARTAPAAPATQPAAGKVTSAVDYTDGLVGAADGIWLCLSAASKLPLGKLRVGKFGLPADTGEKVAAQAYLLDRCKGQLVVALNEAAKHNARAEALARKLATGDASWVLTVGSLAMPFVTSSVALWKGDERLSVKEMAAANETELDRVMETLNEQARQIQAQALAVADPGQNGQGQPVMAG